MAAVAGCVKADSDGYFMMFDTHCHVQFSAFKDDYLEVLKRCQEKNTIINTVGTQKDTSQLAVEIAEKNSNVFATIGLHPIHLFSTLVDEEESHFLSHEENFDESHYASLAESPKVVGVGECGLDLYHLPENINREDVLAKQKKIFLQQLKFAQELNKALVIHVREANKEMIDLLQSQIKSGSVRGVIHCYTGNWEAAKKYLELGFFIGLTGVVTFPPKKNNPQPTLDILEVVKNIPLERLVIETDSPYLAPQAYRGQRCEPWMVEEVAKKIAEIKKMSLSETLSFTLANAQRLFNLV